MHMSRIRRHHLLRELLAGSPASTQEELAAGLTEAGLAVTQATVSRDLAAIGAVRGPDGYRIPEEGGAGWPSAARSPDAEQRLAGVIRDHTVEATPAASMVVLKTAPGHANFVASELDAARPQGMVGCIAGDDTIFIASQSPESAGALARSFQEMMSGTRAPQPA